MEKTEHYRTHQVKIKPGHRLYFYFEMMCQHAKNMYNTTNFYIRQVYTGVKSENPLQPLQKEVLDVIEKQLPILNERQFEIFENNKEKRFQKYALACQKAKKAGKKEPKPPEPNLFSKPTKEKSFLSYGFLNALFKTIKQADYVSLPVQTSQYTMKKVFQDWKNFFASIKEYKVNPSTFSGRPRIPKYRKTDKKEVYFTNQDCVIKGNQLKFPLTKDRLSIGKLSKSDGQLKEVRVNPYKDQFIVELVFQVEEQKKSEKEERLMSTDIGVNNLATIVMNTGHRPVIIKGGVVKSINQFYNKERGRLFGELRTGKQPNEGQFTSKRLQKLDETRFHKIKDYFHKTSHHIVALAVQEKMDVIVIGKNKGWKENVTMRKKDKQHFMNLPFEMLIHMIEYKASEKGIRVVLQEESYTSKASFVDQDQIPVYQPNENTTYTFSGKRVKRGLYRSKFGVLLNADVNGACNILRKAFPHAFKTNLHAEFLKTLQQPVVQKIN